VAVFGARQRPRDQQQHRPQDGVLFLQGVFFQLSSAHLTNAEEDHGEGVERHHCHHPQQGEAHHTLGTPWLRSPSPSRKLLAFLQGHDVAGLSCRTIEQAPHHLAVCSRGATATAAATSNPSCSPQTALSLNSGMELQHLRPDPKTHSDSTSSSHNASIISSAFSSVMAGPPSPTGLFTFRSRKQQLRENPTVGVDRRLQRLIKNRESAARSRARKQTCHLSFSPFQQKCLIFLYETLSTCLQAYTNELELEVSHLKEENAKLMKQYVEATLLPVIDTVNGKRRSKLVVGCAWAWSGLPSILVVDGVYCGQSLPILRIDATWRPVRLVGSGAAATPVQYRRCAPLASMCAYV
ncbi:unnamed protein product, partial [Musa textilis]